MNNARKQAYRDSGFSQATVDLGLRYLAALDKAKQNAQHRQQAVLKCKDSTSRKD